MSNDWFKQRISEAGHQLSHLTRRTIEYMEEMLRGDLSERELPKGVLRDIAERLIVEMSETADEAEDWE